MSDLSALVASIRANLQGSGSLPSEPADHAPLDSVLRAYQSVADRGTFSRAVAACLTDEDASVRAQAALFFEKFPDAAGGEELVKVAEASRALYAGVPNPWMPGNDLEWQLLRSIGARILGRDANALAVGYAAALEKGRAQPLIAALARADAAWVAAHAEDIVRRNPDAAAALVINLQGSGQDVAAVGEKVAPLADDKFRGYIEMFIDDPEIKRRILK
jgi:hypothetical protein